METHIPCTSSLKWSQSSRVCVGARPRGGCDLAESLTRVSNASTPLSTRGHVGGYRPVEDWLVTSHVQTGQRTCAECFKPFTSYIILRNYSIESVRKVSSCCEPTSSSESLDSGWLEAPLRKGSMGFPILAMREMRLALVTSGF